MTELLENIFCGTGKQGDIRILKLTDEEKTDTDKLLERYPCGEERFLSDKWGYFPVFYGTNEEIIRRLGILMKLYPRTAERVEKGLDFISFLLDLEREGFGCSRILDEAYLEKYTMLFKAEVRLEEAASDGLIEQRNYEKWLLRFRACRTGRSGLRELLDYMHVYFGTESMRREAVSDLKSRESLEFHIDERMTEPEKKILFHLIEWDILEAQRRGKRILLHATERMGHIQERSFEKII